jgi:hypothetical protein
MEIASPVDILQGAGQIRDVDWDAEVMERVDTSIDKMPLAAGS